MVFSSEQAERYSRNTVMEEVGEEGQKKLLKSSVLIIGAGGLGSPAALYLAASGVGRIGIVDSDVVELSNLQRQIIHRTADIGRNKVFSAAEKLNALNPDITVEAHKMRLDPSNIGDLIKKYDFVIDATDNFPSKFLINDTCVMNKKPFCHAGVTKFQGQLMTYVPEQGPCYRCVFKEPPPEGVVPLPKETGVMGVICGVIGSLEAMEAVKYLLGKGELLTGYLLTFDALSMQFRKIKLPKRVDDCKACGSK